MNKHNVHDYDHLIQALKEGKTIQFMPTASLPRNQWEDIWEDIDEVAFHHPPECFRVKPEPDVKEYWTNVYKNGQVGERHTSASEADSLVCSGRTAVLYTRIEDDELVEQKLIHVIGRTAHQIDFAAEVAAQVTMKGENND